MPATQINPYLNFGGTAAQAIALYEKLWAPRPRTSSASARSPGWR